MVVERFAFGENWRDYSSTIGSEELDDAMAGLRRLMPANFDPSDKTFLDIGSGSGLHSVAATKMGFSNVTATDYDTNSVETTRTVAARFGVNIEVIQDDILNTAIHSKYDVVYSWGVLHHTGNMPRAIQIAAQLTQPGGLFIIAIYMKTPLCGMWSNIKRTYCAAPSPLRGAMQLTYYLALTARTAANGSLFKKYSAGRGMKRFYDAKDWLGGYPYESATCSELEAMVPSDFELLSKFNTSAGRGIFGTGCGEYVFRRHETASREISIAQADEASPV